MADDKETRDRIKKMIVRRLELKIAPEEIVDAAPLFNEGLGLDSVEALELVVGLEEEFGLQMEEGGDTRARFFSVETLAVYVQEALQKTAVAVQ
jgi:acyl carrier protein